ncbi:MAG: hypothetical protein WCC57_20030 [Paracoccaceae bacterium]
MYARATEMLASEARLMNSRNLFGLASGFDFPLIVEIEGQTILYVTPNAMMTGTADFLGDLAQQGYVSMHPRVRAVEMPRKGRFRIWAHWEHRNAAGVTVSVSDYLYHCRDRARSICVEMVQVQKAAHPALVPNVTYQQFQA